MPVMHGTNSCTRCLWPAHLPWLRHRVPPAGHGSTSRRVGRLGGTASESSTVVAVKIDDAADQFLRSHLWGVLVTIRDSGRPQQSMVAYDWNGTDLVISCRSTAAKFVNASKRTAVAFSVSDDVDCLTIDGVAECHDTGSGRDQATERVRQRLLDGAEWGAAILDQDIATGLDAVNRVTITIIPESIRLVQPLG